MKRNLKVLATLLYIAGLVMFAVYVGYELKSNIVMSVLGRLFLLLGSCLLIYLGSFFKCWNLNIESKTKIMRITNWFFFVLYIILLITLVLFDSMFGRSINIFIWSQESLDFYLKNSFNIIPFKTILEYCLGFINQTMNLNIIIINLLGNFIAFMPFAFFLPRLIKRINNFKTFFVVMLFIALSVELLQFITMSGICDIDDVILNVSGSLILYKTLNISIIKKVINKTIGSEC